MLQLLLIIFILLRRLGRAKTAGMDTQIFRECQADRLRSGYRRSWFREDKMAYRIMWGFLEIFKNPIISSSSRIKSHQKVQGQLMKESSSLWIINIALALTSSLFREEGKKKKLLKLILQTFIFPQSKVLLTSHLSKPLSHNLKEVITLRISLILCISKCKDHWQPTVLRDRLTLLPKVRATLSALATQTKSPLETTQSLLF
jgi:hypothetical protein